MRLNNKNVYNIIYVIFLPTVFYYLYKYKNYNGIYTNSYKEIIIKNFIENINSNLTYSPNGKNELLNNYLDANFDNRSFNKFVTDDYIIGSNEDGMLIELCNISLENMSARNELLDLIYEGIFSTSFLNNRVYDEVTIKTNKVLFKDTNIVEMDSSEFEKYFDVYSNSNILSMEILTHDIMEELVNFYVKYKIKFEIVIKNNNIYIRFDTGSMFEPNILRKSNDINTLWVYYSILNFVTNFSFKINKLLKDVEV